MTRTPEISVIVPVYNSAGVVRAAVSSALAQSFPDLEIICVDDGSSDGSQAVLASLAAADPRVRVIELGSNRGASAARNQGIDRARGNYLFFLDSDDTMPPHALERLLAATRGTGCELAIGKLLWLKRPGDVPEPGYSPSPGDVTTTSLRDSRYLQMISGSHCCNLYRRDLLDRNAIRYQTDMIYGEDQLFQATAIAAAGSVAMLDEIVYIYHHYRGQSVTRKPPTLESLLSDILFHRRIVQLLSEHGLEAAGKRFVGNWSFSIKEYWLRIPVALTPADAEVFFSSFGAMARELAIEQWNDSVPSHHRHLLSLVVDGRYRQAYEFLSTAEARGEAAMTTTGGPANGT